MDTRDVFVIIGQGFTKDKIVEIILAEGYKHNFCFGNDKALLKVSDEVWCFGKCENNELYMFAKDNGCDIWVMG